MAGYDACLQRFYFFLLLFLLILFSFLFGGSGFCGVSLPFKVLSKLHVISTASRKIRYRIVSACSWFVSRLFPYTSNGLARTIYSFLYRLFKYSLSIF